MVELSYTEISDAVNTLDLDFVPLREDARRRYELYSLRYEPYVPDEIAREGKVRIKSPLLIHAAESIRADLMMNPTEFIVIPLARERDGAIPRKLETMSENLERGLAVSWGRMNEGRRVDRDVIWHQLVSPFGVLILEFNDFSMPEQPEWMSDEAYVTLVENYEREWIPWSIYCPDPMTCSWMERDGKPVMFARKYRMTVRDAETYYSKRRGSTRPDESLRLNEDGHFKWASDDYPVDGVRYRTGFTEVNMLWYDDGDYIYHVAENPANDGTGEVVWSMPNPTGRCTAFIVPGNLTPSRNPQDRYEPFLWPLMQAVMHMNDLRSMRATAARNLAGPHTYITLDPEIVKLYMARGEKLPTSVRWRKNETHYLLGQVNELPSELSADWDKLEERLNQEIQFYLPSEFINVVDPAVLKAATATSILHAAEAALRKYGPLMSAYDGAIRDIAESMVTSLRVYYSDAEIFAFASGDEMARGRNLPSGSVYHLNAEAVSFPHKIVVKTRGMSQAQAAAQYDLVLRQWILPDGSKGPATLDDLIDAANYTDRIAQRRKLAVESILNSIDPWIQQQAIEAAREEILLDSGISLPLTMPGAAPGASTEQPSGMPNSAQRMDAPMITGPAGGSAAGLEGGVA